MTVVIDINRSTTKELVQRPGRHRWRFRLGRTIWQCCWDVKRLGSIEIIQVLYFVGGGEGRRGREGGRIISGLTKDDRTVNMELEYFHSSGSNRPGKEENQNPHWIQNRILCLPLLFFLFFFSIFQFFSSSSCSSFFFLFIMVITVCHFVSFDRWNLWRNVHCPPAQWKPTDAGSCLIPAAARCSFNSLGFCLKNSFRLMDYYNLSFFFLFYFWIHSNLDFWSHFLF